jgi:hypothetical protein
LDGCLAASLRCGLERFHHVHPSGAGEADPLEAEGVSRKKFRNHEDRIASIVKSSGPRRSGALRFYFLRDFSLCFACFESWSSNGCQILRMGYLGIRGEQVHSSTFFALTPFLIAATALGTAYIKAQKQWSARRLEAISCVTKNGLNMLLRSMYSLEQSRAMRAKSVVWYRIT